MGARGLKVENTSMPGTFIPCGNHTETPTMRSRDHLYTPKEAAKTPITDAMAAVDWLTGIVDLHPPEVRPAFLHGLR